MLFKMDPGSSTPPFRQIEEQIKYAIATGALRAGEKLPSIREVATQTRVNRNTIAKAYTELERQGIIVSRHGQGSFVSEADTAIQKRQRLKLLEDMVRDLYVEAYHFQISNEEIQQIVRKVEKDFEKGKGSKK